MASEVDINNLALGRIKQGTIADLDPATDDSAEAEACARLYPIARDYVLADFPWQVNTVLQTLAEMTNDREDDWAYKYQRPTCLRIRHLLNETGRHDPRRPVRFEQTDGAIYTDVQYARASISTRVTDTTLYSPALISCIAWWLAYELVGPLEATDSMMQWAQRKYTNEKAAAGATDAAEDLIVDDATSGCQALPGPLAARE